MFLFQFVKHIIEKVMKIYEILLIWWVDPQYPWSQGIGSPIWGSSMTRVKSVCFNIRENMYLYICGLIMDWDVCFRQCVMVVGGSQFTLTLEMIYEEKYVL